jgi:hypothetical protein
MQVRLHGEGLGSQREVVGVQSLVICDDNGNPVAVAIQHGPVIWHTTAGDIDFAEKLKQLGINLKVNQSAL